MGVWYFISKRNSKYERKTKGSNRMLGNEIGTGGTSTVYEWGETEVLKVYKPHVTDDVIQNEHYIGQLLNKLPLEIPRYFGSIELNGRRALIYERIEGKIFAEPFLQGRYKTELAYKFSQMHFDIHKKVTDKLPAQYIFLKNRIIELKNYLGDTASSLLNLLDSIPADNRLCHGDYQPFNIISNSNRSVVIDWNGACSGNPVFDVAWSYMTLNSPMIEQLLGKCVSDTFAYLGKDYLYYYCKLADMDEEQILTCLPIAAARRLYDNNLRTNDSAKNESEWLLELIRVMR